MTERAQAGLALFLLLAAGSVTLLFNLQGAQFDRWDEAAYGGMARNAIEQGSYLVPLNEDGQYAGKVFSKPPLTIWAVALSYSAFGFTITALRLPFALATLGSAVVCFFWGWRMLRETQLAKGAPWFGLAWGLSLVVCEGAMQWGRRARIEPLLVFFLLLALAAYGRTATSRRTGVGWALCSGFALAAAFLTKQLAFGLAALPIFVFEVFRLRRGSWRASLLRLGTTFGVALSMGVTWLYFAYAQVGQKLLDVMFGFSVVSRFAGLSGTKHFNTLNRIPDWLERSAAPFPWVLGLIGTALAVSVIHFDTRQARRATQNAPHESLLVVLFLLVGILVLENGTRSVLPWYAWNLVPSTLFGCAWLVYKGVQLVCERPPQQFTARDGALVALGVSVLWSSFTETFEYTGSKLNAALAFGAAGAAVVCATLPRWPFSFRCSRASASVGVSALVGLSLVLTQLRYPAYLNETPTAAAAMAAVQEARHVSVAPNLFSGDVRFIDQVTMFGPTSKRAEQPPWKDQNRGGFDARVEGNVLPIELRVAPGFRVTRLPGATVFQGDLALAPFAEASLSELLSKGPLTFEAEDMATEAWATRQADSQASGGEARVIDPWLSEDQGSTELSTGFTAALPEGEYVALFFLRWNCRGYVGGLAATLEAASRRTTLRCAPNKQEAYAAESVRFSLNRATGVKLRVGYERGRRLLGHDKTEIWFADVYERLRGSAKVEAARKRKLSPKKRARERRSDLPDDALKDAGP